jgi:hypothetical protein
MERRSFGSAIYRPIALHYFFVVFLAFAFFAGAFFAVFLAGIVFPSL